MAAAAYCSSYYLKLSCRYPQSYPYQHAEELSAKLIDYLKRLEAMST